MGNEVREGVSRLQIFEHRTGHSCIDDEDVDVADFAAYPGCNCSKVRLGGDVASHRDDCAIIHRISCDIDRKTRST